MISILLVINILLTLYCLYNIAAVQHLVNELIRALSGDYTQDEE